MVSLGFFASAFLVESFAGPVASSPALVAASGPTGALPAAGFLAGFTAGSGGEFLSDSLLAAPPLALLEPVVGVGLAFGFANRPGLASGIVLPDADDFATGSSGFNPFLGLTGFFGSTGFLELSTVAAGDFDFSVAAGFDFGFDLLVDLPVSATDCVLTDLAASSAGFAVSEVVLDFAVDFADDGFADLPIASAAGPAALVAADFDFPLGFESGFATLSTLAMARFTDLRFDSDC